MVNGGTESGLMSDEVVVLSRRAPGPPGRLSFRRGDLSGFHQLFEPMQINFKLLFGGLAEEQRDLRTDDSSGRIIVQLYGDLGAASARGALKSNRPGVVDVRALERTPRDQ